MTADMTPEETVYVEMVAARLLGVPMDSRSLKGPLIEVVGKGWRRICIRGKDIPQETKNELRRMFWDILEGTLDPKLFACNSLIRVDAALRLCKASLLRMDTRWAILCPAKVKIVHEQLLKPYIKFLATGPILSLHKHKFEGNLPGRFKRAEERLVRQVFNEPPLTNEVAAAEELQLV